MGKKGAEGRGEGWRQPGEGERGGVRGRERGREEKGGVRGSERE